jgi:zinc/manganese transport system substrate-binding protein
MGYLRAGAALAAFGLLLAACGSPAPPSGPSVVASTDVYGAIAGAVAGDAVRVTSIIHSAGSDPHEYESTPSDALAVSKATVVVYNGAGYDDFATELLGAARTKPTEIDVSALSGFDTEAPDFNEHVWYSLPTVKKLADALAADLAAADPAHAATFTANAKAFDAQVDGLITKVDTIKARHSGARVAITEPVPGYLLRAAGLVVATPQAFSQAVEQGTDPPAAVVTANLSTFTGPDKVAALVENAQTEGPTTTQAEQAAAANGVPVVKVTETLPSGVTDYVTWMSRQVDALGAALDIP